MTRAAAAVLMCVCAGAAAAAIQAVPTPRDVSEAVAIGQSRDARERTRFHAPYRLAVNRAPVDFIDVVTPFRRVVLAAEARASVGDRAFGQREALALLAAAPGELEILVELTFHPLNTYVGVPDYVVSLEDTRGMRLQARASDRLPRYGPRVEGPPSPVLVPGGPILPGGSQPLLGGTVVARFELGALNATANYGVIVEEARKEIARTRANFAAMR